MVVEVEKITERCLKTEIERRILLQDSQPELLAKYFGDILEALDVKIERHENLHVQLKLNYN